MHEHTNEKAERLERKRQQMRHREELVEHMRSHSFDELAEQLHRGTEDEQRAAAIVLGEAGDTRAVPALLQILETTRSDDVRNGTAIALHDLADARAASPILRQIRRLERLDGDYDTLVWALETMNPRTAVVDLARIICRGYYAAALMAIGVLEALHGPLRADDKRHALELLAMCPSPADDTEDRADMVALAEKVLVRMDTEEE